MEDGSDAYYKIPQGIPQIAANIEPLNEKTAQTLVWPELGLLAQRCGKMYPYNGDVYVRLS